MKTTILAALAALSGAGAAQAAPALVIRDAAVRVVVVPEARSDVEVTVLKTSARLPFRVEHVDGSAYVTGRLPTFLRTCGGEGESLRVAALGLGEISAADFPSIVVHVPMDAKVDAGGVVLGSVGRARTVSLANGGCGDWTVANTADVLSVRNSGSGRVQAGTAGSADLTMSGSGRMTVGAVQGLLRSRISGAGSIQAQAAGEADLVLSGSGGLKTGPVARGLRGEISGSGDVNVASLNGPMDVRVSGVGHVRVPQGQVTAMRAAISGSGGVDFGGAAETLEARVSGVGDVRAGTVTGTVDQHISGAGRVRVGERELTRAD